MNIAMPHDDQLLMVLHYFLTEVGRCTVPVVASVLFSHARSTYLDYKSVITQQPPKKPLVALIR